MGGEPLHCSLSNELGQSTSVWLHLSNFSDVKEPPRC
jgi:hypothetical protein